ncbi:ribosomal protein S18-alanine N-acetyltransferase [Idiomarina sp. HP20-50]|uniref:ribosomal protein S18-alanine N-acetyltransferase n=1 Tax=Idiomarina sp. HP20-50 TaxID=3070813 RepID=UPI00294B34C1|nr:ribosomal protein S18-alanine N-acetyltransferase [Idiomarina sp. HP20-50]MDV6317126.1 ribosomal protein S18-alanine N-acetyltransferase [Idiomarina sp. HP20-50]
MQNVSLENFQPGALEFAVEEKAHGKPWSWPVFSQSYGGQYRCRRLMADGRVIGFTISQLIVDELTLHNIAVDPAYQGRGFGNFLIKDLLDYAKEKQCIVFLEVRASNLSAIRLYERNEFDTVGRRVNYYPMEGGHEDALVMRWACQK